jgi:predicted transcriptional regulator
MTLREIAHLLEGDVLYPEADLDREVPCAFASDMISDILMCTKEPTLLLTGLTNNQVIRLSDMIDLSGIVFVRGKKPLQDVIEMATERGLPIISTKFTLYRSSGSC